MKGREEVLDEGLEEGWVEEGDAQPARLTGFEVERAVAWFAEADERGDGEWAAGVGGVEFGR